MRCISVQGVANCQLEACVVYAPCVCVMCVKCVQKEAKVLKDTRTWNSHKAIVEYTQIYILQYKEGT